MPHPVWLLVMAALHAAYPNLRSQEVEEMVRRDFTHQLQSPEGPIEVLDYAETYNSLGARVQN